MSCNACTVYEWVGSMGVNEGLFEIKVKGCSTRNRENTTGTVDKSKHFTY